MYMNYYRLRGIFKVSFFRLFKNIFLKKLELEYNRV